MPKPPHQLPGYRYGASAGANSTNKPLDRAISCHICGKSKPTTEYANRQLQKLPGYNQYAPANSKDRPVCKSCTPKQITDLHCKICKKTKLTKYFNKTQRHDPDNARCRKCVQVNEHRLAGIEHTVDSDHYTDGAGSDSESDLDDDGDEPVPAKKTANRKKDQDSDSDEDIDGSDDDEKPTKKAATKQKEAESKYPLQPSSQAPSVSQSNVGSCIQTPLISTGLQTPIGSDATPGSLVNSGSNEWQTVAGNKATKKNAFRSGNATSWNTPGDRTPSFPASGSRTGDKWNKDIKHRDSEANWFSPGGQPSMVPKKIKQPVYSGMPAELDESDDEE